MTTNTKEIAAFCSKHITEGLNNPAYWTSMNESEFREALFWICNFGFDLARLSPEKNLHIEIEIIEWALGEIFNSVYQGKNGNQETRDALIYAIYNFTLYDLCNKKAPYLAIHTFPEMSPEERADLLSLLQSFWTELIDAFIAYFRNYEQLKKHTSLFSEAAENTSSLFVVDKEDKIFILQAHLAEHGLA